MERPRWASRSIFLLAAVGSAVGLGNVWRFPYLTYKYGGGAFLIPWILALFLWSIPLLMVEFGLGKTSRRGTVGAFARVAGVRHAWMGGFVGFCTLAILFYYSVVAGWCLRYFLAAAAGRPGERAVEFWESFAGSGSLGPVLFHGLALGIGVVIISRLA